MRCVLLFQSVTKKLTSKGGIGTKGDGGTDSGNTSRASTPVSDRSVKVLVNHGNIKLRVFEEVIITSPIYDTIKLSLPY